MGSSLQRFGIAIKLALTLFNFITSGIVGSRLETEWSEEVDNGISLNVLIFGSVIECCLLALILMIATCNNDTETLLCACEKIPLLLIIGLIEGPLLYWLGLSSYYTIGYPREYLTKYSKPLNFKTIFVEVWYSVWLVSTLFQSLVTLLLGCDC